jgi:outer membrane protein OmpA-like peptidoglycan-associated protein
MRLRYFFALVMFLIFGAGVYAQTDTIYLTNPSFEDMPRHSKAPRGWHDCGFEGESAPDVQPSGTFSVTKPAHHGNTYLGMVVRDNDTWERVSQRLSRPMDKDMCYNFSIFLARSELYVSISRTSEETANYTTPSVLRIYGGFGNCDTRQVLAESPVISNTEWQEFQFKFEPKANYTYIVLEAFYKTPVLFPYNGNLLLDNASPLTPVICQEPIAARASPNNPVARPQETSPSPPRVNVPPRTEPDRTTTERPNESPFREMEPRAVIDDVDFNRLKKSDLSLGQTLRINNLLFEVDRAIITAESYKVLDDLYRFLANNREVTVEIGGHTNGLCSDPYCTNLSTNRAKAVADYLAKKGISPIRLQYKGYGKSQLIANDDTEEGRRKNQRVEIKIVKLGG